MDRPLRVLYISHYYPPEVNAPAARVSEMAEEWVKMGAQVTVLTCFPNHPSGVIPHKYRGYKRLLEFRNNIKIVRTYVYATPNRGFFKRVLNFISFMFSSIILGIRHIGKPDILIATSPQFFVAVAGYVISRLKRCRFVFEVRDVWPEEIVAVGAIKNRIAIKLLEALEMFLYGKADHIVTVAQGTIDILTARGIPSSKIVYIPNGVNIGLFKGRSGADSVRKKIGASDDFLVGYIGTHGIAHRLEIVLEAADRVRNYERIRFLLVGDGAEKENLKRKSAEMQLSNVVFHDQVDRETVPDYYAACDVCLVILRKADLFTRNIPSKIYEIMAAGKPIIISTNGESRRLVEGADAGLATMPEDPDDLAEKIVTLFRNRTFRENMGVCGSSYAKANCARDRLAHRYLNILKTIAFGPKTRFTIKHSGESSESKNKSHGRKRESAKSISA